MPKNKLPETSLEAYHALQPGQLREMYNKIVGALKILGAATYEELSDYLGCQDRNMISRRLKEMMPKDASNPKGLNLIFKTGNKRLTKRNRNAFVYQLTDDGVLLNTGDVIPINKTIVSRHLRSKPHSNIQINSSQLSLIEQLNKQ